MKTPLTLFVALISIPTILFAHGTGVSYEETIGNYRVDIGYDSETVEAGTQARFDFRLLNEETSETDEFTDLWVRIEEGNKTLFAGGIHKATFGTTGFLYVFPKEGAHEIFVRYQKEGDVLVETSFPLEVVKNTSVEGGAANPSLATLSAGILIGALVGFGASIVLRRKKT